MVDRDRAMRLHHAAQWAERNYAPPVTPPALAADLRLLLAAVAELFRPQHSGSTCTQDDGVTVNNMTDPQGAA